MIEKSLVLSPERVSLVNLLSAALAGFSGEVSTYDVKSAMGRSMMVWNTRMQHLSYRFRQSWNRWFLSRANELIMQKIISCSPDLVLVYNSEFLLPETCAWIKERSKLLFFLADSPFYTFQNDYYLACLVYADLILVPDTFWMKQLHTIGLDNAIYFIPGLEEDDYRKVDPEMLDGEEQTDLLYVGTSYKNPWGYKKAMLLSQFTSFRLRIYGNDAWERWFPYFPELEECYRKTGFIGTEKLNRMFNAAKLIPVDGNPAILNGVHLRLMEALAAGTLPLIEYRRDIDNEIFSDCGFRLPLIRNYNEAKETAGYWLSNDRERIETAEAMKKHIQKKYSAVNNAARIMEALGV